MKKNVNVFIGVVLCAVLCGIFVWLSGTEENNTWGPSEIYYEMHGSSSSGSSYTNATFSSSNDGGLALSMSASSSVFRHRSASLYAGATSSSISLPSLQGGAGGRLNPSLQGGAGGRLIPSLQGGVGGSLSSGGGLYTTSSAEIKSFGGGGNGGSSMGGGSMRGTSSSNTPIASSPISLPSLQGGAGGRLIPSLQGGAGGRLSSLELAQMASENPAIDMASAANMDYTAFGTSVAGFYNAYTSGSYGSYGNYGGGRSGIRGRQNALGFNDAWWVWFDTWVRNNGDSYYDDETKGYYFDRYSLESVYNAFLANFWNSGMGEEPSFDEWLDWYQEAMNNSNGYYDYYYGDELYNRYYWVPVGDILPLLLIALLYLVFVAIKSKSLKSLLKTERSE